MKFSFSNGIPADCRFNIISNNKSLSIFTERQMLKLNKNYIFLLDKKTSRVILSYIYKCPVIWEHSGLSNSIITHLTNSSKV